MGKRPAQQRKALVLLSARHGSHPAPAPPRRAGSIDVWSAEGRTGRSLLSLVANSDMSVHAAQLLCRDIVADYGDKQDLVSEIACLGTAGKHAQNTLRDFLRRSRASLEPALVDISVLGQTEHEVLEVKHPVLYCHEVVAEAYDKLPRKLFESLFMGRGGREELQRYWDKFSTEEWVREHPGFREGNAPARSNIFPVFIHADKGQHIHHDKILVIGWGSCTVSLATLLCHFLFTLLAVGSMIVGKTDEQLYAVLVWCMRVLQSGVHPWFDHAGREFPKGSLRWLRRGTPIAGGLCGFFSETRSDWEWHADTFGWRCWRNNFICHRDWASKVCSCLHFTNWSPNAMWRTTQISHAAYLASNPHRRTVLETMPGWRLERTRGDTMHAVNLGVCLLLIGNVLRYLARVRAYLYLAPANVVRLPPDASLTLVLYDLYLRFKLWCRRRGFSCTVHKFTEKNTQAFGVLKYNCKAAKAVYLTKWLCELTAEFAGLSPADELTTAQTVSAACWGLAEYFRILRAGDRYLSDSELERLEYASNAFLYMYTDLNQQSPEGQWVITPKFHVFQHIVLDAMASTENPANFHCFSAEDMVGKCMRWAIRAHPKTCAATVLGKYVLYLAILWRDAIDNL